MELEDRKKIEMFLENIICSEARLIAAKNTKLRADKEYERKKDHLETMIKHDYHDIAIVQRKAILKQKGCEWTPDDLHLCEEESEKEFQRWKNCTPGEKIKEHRERIGMLRNDVPSQTEINEDWEPMTDIEVDRWIEEENEKEIERRKKLTCAERFWEDVERRKQLQEAEKNNWYCSN